MVLVPPPLLSPCLVVKEVAKKVEEFAALY